MHQSWKIMELIKLLVKVISIFVLFVHFDKAFSAGIKQGSFLGAVCKCAAFILLLPCLQTLGLRAAILPWTHIDLMLKITWSYSSTVSLGLNRMCLCCFWFFRLPDKLVAHWTILHTLSCILGSMSCCSRRSLTDRGDVFPATDTLPAISCVPWGQVWEALGSLRHTWSCTLCLWVFNCCRKKCQVVMTAEGTGASYLCRARDPAFHSKCVNLRQQDNEG